MNIYLRVSLGCCGVCSLHNSAEFRVWLRRQSETKAHPIFNVTSALICLLCIFVAMSTWMAFKLNATNNLLETERHLRVKLESHITDIKNDLESNAKIMSNVEKKLHTAIEAENTCKVRFYSTTCIFNYSPPFVGPNSQEKASHPPFVHFVVPP